MDTFLWVINPLNFSPIQFFSIYILHVLSKYVLEALLLRVVKLVGTPTLQSRKADAIQGYQAMVFSDYAFLFINSWIEYAFTQHTYILAVHSGKMPMGFNELNLLNTIPAFVLMFAADDLFYAPAHRFMHWQPVYWLVHKHHHRQVYPFRGYHDAANESPIEQIVGQACVFGAIYVTIAVTGLHVFTLLVWFVLYAATAMLNHTPYDVKLRLPFEYTVRAHEMHHRFVTCNYAQNFMLWDYLMGTFRNYQA